MRCIHCGYKVPIGDERLCYDTVPSNGRYWRCPICKRLQKEDKKEKPESCDDCSHCIKVDTETYKCSKTNYVICFTKEWRKENCPLNAVKKKAEIKQFEVGEIYSAYTLSKDYLRVNERTSDGILICDILSGVNGKPCNPEPLRMQLEVKEREERISIPDGLLWIVFRPRKPLTQEGFNLLIATKIARREKEEEERKRKQEEFDNLCYEGLIDIMQKFNLTLGDIRDIHIAYDLAPARVLNKIKEGIGEEEEEEDDA